MDRRGDRTDKDNVPGMKLERLLRSVQDLVGKGELHLACCVQVEGVLHRAGSLGRDRLRSCSLEHLRRHLATLGADVPVIAVQGKRPKRPKGTLFLCLLSSFLPLRPLYYPINRANDAGRIDAEMTRNLSA